MGYNREKLRLRHSCGKILEWYVVKWIPRAAAMTAVAILMASLIPLLLLGQYCAPSADDFGYGAPVHFALEAGLGLPGVLAALWENLRYTFQNWQGTFASILLFSIQPGAFNWDAYPITVFVMLAVIIAPVFLVLWALPGRDKSWSVLLGCIIAFLSVQFLPSLGQGVFWWNGAAHYLVFWFLGVAMALCQLRLGFGPVRKRRFPFRVALACAGCFFVGGGNYSTALVFALISAFFTGLVLIRRRPRPVLAANALMTFFAAAGLVVSMVAPGNAVRQAGLGQLPALTAIAASFQQAWQDIAAMTDGKMLAALVLCVPLFLCAIQGWAFRFPLPLLVPVGGFCAFAALYTPPLYAMGVSAVPRMENLFWLAYVFLLFGSGFYLAGWLSRHLPPISCQIRIGAGAIVGTAGALALAVLLLGQVRESSAYLAYADLNSPVLATYLQERAQRRALAEDDTTPPPRFTVMSGYPTCFPVSQLLTWSSDVLIDGAPTSLRCYHSCGGEVNYIGLERVLDYFDSDLPLTLDDFSARFHIGTEDCVPLREVCDYLGYTVTYDTATDTISISTNA